MVHWNCLRVLKIAAEKFRMIIVTGKKKIIVTGKYFIDIDTKNVYLIAYYETLNYLRNVPTSYDISFYAYIIKSSYENSYILVCLFVWMGFNATFNNISVISWRSVLLVEEAGENHQPWAGNWQTLSRQLNATRFCMVQTQARTHAVLVIGYSDLYR